MKPLIAAFVLTVLTLNLSPAIVNAQHHEIDPDRYGAIAYSPKTGMYGYGWNHGSRAAAEKAALSECKADDAKVVTWVQFGWAALVIADDKAYGYDEVHGDGASSKDAYDNALKNLRENSKAKVKTVIIICSGDVKPRVTDY